MVEYLFGPSDTKYGALRVRDGAHPHPYNMDKIMLEVGNERMPGTNNQACLPTGDCVAAFFNFAERAQARADELNLGKLPIVLALYAWGLFDPTNAIQKGIIQRAASKSIYGPLSNREYAQEH